MKSCRQRLGARGAHLTVDRTRFRGNSAVLSTSDEAVITCGDGSAGSIFTSLFIQGLEQDIRSTFGDSDTETVFVFFSQFNTCTEESVNAVVFDDAPDFDQSRLDSASITGEYELIDFEGNAVGTLLVDIDFTGVGDITRQNSHSVTQSGDFLFNSRFNGTFRQATVSGTLSFEGEDISTSGDFAQLSNTRSGDITITH